MNPRHLKLFGITRFRDPIHLDLTTLPKGLICLVGGNGAGKTTIMECMAPAAIYRRMPTRDSRRGLLDVATHRDAYVDLEIEHAGHVWRLLHQLHPEHSNGRGKAEAFLFKDGKPITAGRLPDFDEAVAAVFPPRSIVMASAYAAQGGGGGFVSLSVADRRDLFADMLGLGELQDLAERSRTHRKSLDAADGELKRRRERLAGELERHGELVARLAELAPLEKAASYTHEDARQNVGIGRETLALMERDKAGQVEARRVAIDRKASIDAQLENGRHHHDHSTAKLATVQAVVAQADQVRADDAKRLELEDDRTEAAASWREASALLRANEATSAPLLVEVQALAPLAGKVEGVVDLEEAQTDHSAIVIDVAASRGDLHKLRDELAKHRAPDVIRGELERSTVDAALVGRVPCEGGWLSRDTHDNVNCGECELLTGAQAARARAPFLEGELKRSEAAQLATAHKQVEVDAGTATLELAEQLVTACNAHARLEVVRAEIAAGDIERQRLQIVLDEAASKGQPLAREIKALGDTAGRLANLTTAEAQQPLIAQRIADLEGVRDRLQAELEALVIPDLDADLATRLTRQQAIVETFDAELTAAAAAHDDLKGRISATQGGLDELGDVPAKLAKLDEASAGIGLRRQGFVLLEQALGRDGIQALEIDAAGPEVSHLATELLSACYGGRFTAELRTLREAEGARKAREVFDLLVHDGRRGGVRKFEELSGGESAIVDEALKLAIAVFNARRQGEIGTLWRDEADGRLDPERAAAFPTMLRKAIELGGFERLYYVSHNPIVQAQADARIILSGGRARVEV